MEPSRRGSLLIGSAAVIVPVLILRLGQIPGMAERVNSRVPGRVLVAILRRVRAAPRPPARACRSPRSRRRAPGAYTLSALAAAVYIVATVALARNARRVALAACGFELLGVLTVGTLSILDGEAFPDATVWSDYGQGYGDVPLVLPIVGLWWPAARPSHRVTAAFEQAIGPDLPADLNLVEDGDHTDPRLKIQASRTGGAPATVQRIARSSSSTRPTRSSDEEGTRN